MDTGLIPHAEKALDESLKIAQGLIENLPPTTDMRTMSILVGVSFELLFDIMLEFRYRTNRFSNDWMINKKRIVLEEEGILPEVFSSDIKQIIDIRNHCSHNFEIDEHYIKKKLYGTRTYERHVKQLKDNTLEQVLRLVSTLILNIVRTQFSHHITNYLNELEGWE